MLIHSASHQTKDLGWFIQSVGVTSLAYFILKFWLLEQIKSLAGNKLRSNCKKLFVYLAFGFKKAIDLKLHFQVKCGFCVWTCAWYYINKRNKAIPWYMTLFFMKNMQLQSLKTKNKYFGCSIYHKRWISRMPPHSSSFGIQLFAVVQNVAFRWQSEISDSEACSSNILFNFLSLFRSLWMNVLTSQRTCNWILSCQLRGCAVPK